MIPRRSAYSRCVARAGIGTPPRATGSVFPPDALVCLPSLYTRCPLPCGDACLAKGAQQTREEAEPQRGTGVHVLARVLNRRTLPCPALRAPSLKAVHPVLHSPYNRLFR